MTEQTKQGSRWQKFVIFVLAPFAASLLCFWGFASVTGAHFGDKILAAHVDPFSAARSYIQEHPIDSAGWMAFANSALLAVPGAPPPAAATQALAIAAMLAPVDSQVLRGRALVALLAGDIALGLSHTANMAVLFPTESRDAFTILRSYSNHPVWPGFFQARLASGWTAAESFLLDSCQSGASLDTLLVITQTIIRHQPLAGNTVTCVGTKAIAEGRVSTARWLWINALATVPSPLGNVFNGDFERPLTDQLFDWHVSAGGEYREGFAAGIRLDDSRGSRNKVLAIKFNGRPLTPPVAQQFLALTPGRYTLSYSIREIALSALGSITWTIRCVPTQPLPVIGATQKQPLTGGWFNHSHTLVIPEGCDGQLLDLQLGNRLQLALGLQGSVLFDDVSVIRQ